MSHCQNVHKEMMKKWGTLLLTFWLSTNWIANFQDMCGHKSTQRKEKNFSIF